MSSKPYDPQPMSLVTDESATSLGEFMEARGSYWQEDTEDCNVCNKRFGMRRRHHCRICGRCVCHGCSPSAVQLEGFKVPQRACSLCISGAEKLPILKQRFWVLGDRLGVMAGLSPARSEAKTMEDAAVMCEAALVPLEEAQAAMMDRVSSLEARLQEERSAREQAESQLAESVRSMIEIGSALHSIGGSPPCSTPAPTSSAADAVAFCEAALAPLREARRSRRSRSLSVHSPASYKNAGDEGTVDFGMQPISNTCKAEGDESWEADTANCSHCGCRMGKRYFKMRHHCRICGKCVCATCSPNAIQFDGQRKPQRACIPCVSTAQQAPILKKRLSLLADRLRQLNGSVSPTFLVAEPANVEQALSMCENILDEVPRSSPRANTLP